MNYDGEEEEDADRRLPEHVEVEAEEDVGAQPEDDVEDQEQRENKHLQGLPSEALPFLRKNGRSYYVGTPILFNPGS